MGQIDNNGNITVDPDPLWDVYQRVEIYLFIITTITRRIKSNQI